MPQIDFSRYKGFIFDMDGTLVDSMPAHLEAWRCALLKQDAPVHLDFVGDRGGMPTLKIAYAYNQAFDLNLDEERIMRDKRAFFDELWQQVKRIEATTALLTQYQGQKKMALATGADRNNMQRITNNLQLEGYFNSMICADDVSNHKPEPDTFLTAAQKINLAPEQCLVFEDTQLGLQAAQNAGMDCVIIEEGQLAHFHPAPMH